MARPFPISILIILCLSDTNGQGHPLDPLTPAEIQLSVDIVHNTFPIIRDQDWRFNWITLKEPEKVLLLPSFLGATDPSINSIPRKAFIILMERKTNTIAELIVNLNTRTVEEFSKLPQGTQTFYNKIDELIAEEAVRKDEEIKRRCREMGWSDMNDVVMEFWSVTYKDSPALKNSSRPMQVFFYGQLFRGDNFYAHPFDFTAAVDVTTQRVFAIDYLPTHSDYNTENRDGNICPKTPANYNPKFRDENFLRKDVKPIFFKQPDGPGFQLRGNEITWQKFNMRVGFNGRDGLLIHHVSYNDGGIKRPLFYRMSLASLFVPYGDPRPPFQRKFPFDQEQFTLGYLAINQKEAGICVGGQVAYLDVYLNDEFGVPNRQKACICIYEEDAGLLWSHLDVDGKVLHTRSQRLTISSFYNLGNYDYIVSWRFYQDASVEFHSQLHGIVSTTLLAKGVTDSGGFGIAVAPQINGQYHQHNFVVRVDPTIDGESNSVSAFDIVPVPAATGSKTNPYGQGFTYQVTPLRTPAEARTNISPSTGRTWLINNPQKIHPYTKRPVSWKLIPFVGPPLFVRKDSPLHPFCAFADYNVWVTKYKEGQVYPGGLYNNGTSGLPEWVNTNPNVDITQTDLVLWYVFGFTHLPRTEDFPVMPGEVANFFLKPTNFFLENPAIDVPPPKPAQTVVQSKHLNIKNEKG
ncbi:unnamed protein product [Orchesella dallaii]|uniref:Amine oxidase n=1 Tax=Orchesella dallaii TaxID=48710 RepID=A0ABP1PVD1_9HEXA